MVKGKISYKDQQRCRKLKEFMRDDDEDGEKAEEENVSKGRDNKG